MNIRDLTPEQRAELMRDLEAEKRQQREMKQLERKVYDELKADTVREAFNVLNSLSKQIERVKNNVFEAFTDVLELKKEVYEISDKDFENQESHTFTTPDNRFSIILGSNTIDRWDESVDVGIARVNAWIDKLAYDERSAVLASIIRELMKPNKDGVLKANRILDLNKKAAELGDKELIEAVELIRDAYRPQKTSTYIKAKYRDSEGRDVYLPLSIASIKSKEEVEEAVSC